MKWGVRNSGKSSGFRFQSSGPVIDSNIHSSTKTAAKEVAALMSQRYGFNITEVKDLKLKIFEYSHGTAAFVKYTPGTKGGQVYIRPEDIRKQLKDTEAVGWMKPGTTNVRITFYESAHAMFHAEQSVRRDFRKQSCRW
jgi:hypothetical protein